MNAVEIEEAVSALANEPFDATEFPFAFLAAFGNKETTIRRLRAGASNGSDVPGAILQRNHIHIATCAPGAVASTLAALKTSPRTAKNKVKFIVATDGKHFAAEELSTSEPLECTYPAFPSHFGFFLPLAGISTVAEIKDNPIDIKATGRLNKLYMELLKDNPDWDTDARRADLNQFMARLIFCLFAEDTGIFLGETLFTSCIRQMSDATNTHEVIQELFRAMDTKPKDRATANLKSWADGFPHVNGGLFTKQIDVPKFSRTARAYLLRAGELDWKSINPDIFGSMIQAVASDTDERGQLGMHYTSVPNILKVLNPLFLDDLNDQLDKAADNPRALLNLRKRISHIRVFDPACGSGNFLVIAYIKMREIEAKIVERRGETGDWQKQKSWIKLTNFFGIEIKSFAAEIARLALLIAEFQCNVRLIGQREARMDVLPLHDTGKIVTDNALRLDWNELCPPTAQYDPVERDLGGPTGKMALGDAEAKPTTYICGNPPYLGSTWQAAGQKSDIKSIVAGRTSSSGFLDYVSGWFLKAASYLSVHQEGAAAFVCTNSVCQGQMVPILWPMLFAAQCKIEFAFTSFRWSNLASNKAGVTVVIVGISANPRTPARLYQDDGAGELRVREGQAISPYLTFGSAVHAVDDRRVGAGLFVIVAVVLLPGMRARLLSEVERGDGMLTDRLLVLIALVGVLVFDELPQTNLGQVLRGDVFTEQALLQRAGILNEWRDNLVQVFFADAFGLGA